MKTKTPTVESLRNFWNALPDCASFRHFFDNPLFEVEQAETEVKKIEAGLAEWKQMRKEAIERLARRVESAAAAEWSAEQIAKAKQEGGGCEAH